MSAVIDAHAKPHFEGDILTGIERVQEIPEDFLRSLRELKDTSARDVAGEFHQVASIPVALVETWMHQGFDVYRESAKAIISRLRAHNLEAFITTQKAI